MKTILVVIFLFASGPTFAGESQLVLTPRTRSVTAGLTIKEVDSVLRSKLEIVEPCYDYLTKQPEAVVGKYQPNIEFLIDKNGKVSKLKFVPPKEFGYPKGDFMLMRCLESKRELWQFPKPKGSVSVKAIVQIDYNLFFPK